jgi:ribonuclease P protein component
MIKKIYRLKEKEIKKVLKFKKPFFSYNIIANYIKNNLWYNRFAILLSHKNTKTSVSRNFFRRKMYTLVSNSIYKSSFDIVFVPKKWKTFDKKKKEDILGFENDISFLIKKILTV